MKSYNLFNIKGFIDSGDVDIKPVTVLIGKNSSGKSSLARFLIVLKQTLLSLKQSPLVFYDEKRNFVDYGEIRDVMYNNDLEEEIGFSITIDKNDLVRKENYLYAALADDDNMTYEDNEDAIRSSEMDMLKKYLGAVDVVTLKIFMKKAENKLIVSRFICLAGKENVLLELSREEDSRYLVKIFAEAASYHVPEGAVMFENFLPNYRMFDLKYPKWKSEKVLFLYELFYSINLYLKEVAKGIQYIGPFREAPHRYYRRDEETADFVGVKGEAAPAILVDDFRNGQKIINSISAWLRKHLGVELSVIDADGSFSITIKSTETFGIKNNLMDVGYGMTQLIPILVEIYQKKIKVGRSSTPTVTIIEQPELHLHPAAQASLADLFLENYDKNNRFLIETHSENLILRLRRRVVENPELRENLAVYYIEKEKEGNSVVKRLFIDEKGDIPNWPKGLLAEDFYELMEIKKAANKEGSEETRGGFTW